MRRLILRQGQHARAIAADFDDELLRAVFDDLVFPLIDAVDLAAVA